MKSEFGKGLVVNLVKFSEHFSTSSFQRIKNVVFYQSKSEKVRASMMSDCPPPEHNYGRTMKEDIKFFIDCEYKIYHSFEEGISHLIATWANGATDHLYEIKTPKGKEWSDVRKLVGELQSKGLDMGHGFKDITYKLDDALELWELTKKIALLVDEKLGLKPDWGEW